MRIPFHSTIPVVHSTIPVHRIQTPRAMIGSNLDTCRYGPPLIKLMGYEHREDAMGGGGSKQCQIHTHTHTECHTGWMEPRDKDHTQS